jgi:hypothetical protein
LPDIIGRWVLETLAGPARRGGGVYSTAQDQTIVFRDDTRLHHWGDLNNAPLV